MSNFYRPYFQEYADLAFSDSLYKTLDEFKSMALEVKAGDSKLIFSGNHFNDIVEYDFDES